MKKQSLITGLFILSLSFTTSANAGWLSFLGPNFYPMKSKECKQKLHRSYRCIYEVDSTAFSQIRQIKSEAHWKAFKLANKIPDKVKITDKIEKRVWYFVPTYTARMIPQSPAVKRMVAKIKAEREKKERRSK